MRWFLGITTWFLCLAPRKTFNLEPRLAILKISPNSNHSDFFGYSLATHQVIHSDSLQSLVLVGAPKYRGKGALYQCPLTVQKDDCGIVQKGKSKGEWFGAVLSSQGPGRKVIVCAPRLTRRQNHAHLGHGQCLTLDQTLSTLGVWDPCENRANRRVHEEWGVCQAGQSALLTEDDIALIGAPGAYTWRGSVFALSVDDDFLMRDKKHYHTSVDHDDKNAYLGSSLAVGDFLGHNNHLGQCRSKLVFAAGAPRTVGKGQVLIFSQCRDKHRNNDLRVQRKLQNSDVASGFGYTLVALDFDGDQHQELVVAAPFNMGQVYFYHNLGPEKGLVEDHFRVRFEAPNRLVEARFGFALANAGDLDRDGRQDLIVGAPFDGRGKIFVYMGRERGKERFDKPDQIVMAEDLDHLGHSLRSFGYSISSPGLDLDLNGHSDLAVGAFESEAIVLLRSRPVIDLITWFGAHPRRIDADFCVENKGPCFELEACFRVEQMPHGVSAVALRYRLQADAGRRLGPPRAGFVGQTGGSALTSLVERVGTLRPNSLSGCFVERVALDHNLRDVTRPLVFLLSLSLEQTPPSLFSQISRVADINAYPILNQKEALKELSIPFKLACGQDDRCDSNLTLSSSIANKKEDVFVVDNKEREVLVDLDVANAGEAAYEAVAKVFFDNHVFQYVGRTDDVKDVHCELQDEILDNEMYNEMSSKGLLECHLGNPFVKERRTKLILKFLPLDPSELIVNSSIISSVSTSSINDVAAVTSSKVDLRVERRSELTLFSSVQPKNVFMENNGAVRGESAMRTVSDVGFRVTHTFQVSNDGPWDASNVHLRILFPIQKLEKAGKVENHPKKGREGKWLLYLTQEPEVSNEAICVVGNPRMINALGLPYGRNAQIRAHRRHQYRLHVERRQQHVVRQSRVRRQLDRMSELWVEQHLECDHSASCLIIDCHMNRLASNSSAVVRLRSRLWNATFAEMDQGLAAIHTRAAIVSSDNLQENREDDRALAVLFVVPSNNGVDNPPKWLLLLAVLIGVLILALITATLYKLGFFRRRRVPREENADRERDGLIQDKRAPITPRFQHNESREFIS